MTESIAVFANSGHHYSFVPLTDALKEATSAWTSFDGHPLWRSDQGQWQEHPSEPWIRFRPGERFVLEFNEVMPGYWLAIETNLGTAERGFVYEPNHPIAPFPVDSTYDRLATPYAFIDANQLQTKELTLRVEDPRTGTCVGELPLPTIVWTKASAEEPIDVDLVIDFGNTRTIAVLIERLRGLAFNQICRPVRFVPRGSNYAPQTKGRPSDDSMAIVDSWVVLHEAMFSGLEPPSLSFKPQRQMQIAPGVPSWRNRNPPKQVVGEALYFPQMFVELSPALMGGGNDVAGARQVLQKSRLEHGANLFLSSPKRYAWDSDRMGRGGNQFWHVALNRWNPGLTDDHPKELARVQGPVLLLMDSDGRYWDIDQEPAPNERPDEHHRPHANDNPTHPRRDTLTWAALAILETAYRQINSEEFRKARSPFVPRRLRSLVTTFPAGWTSGELDNYRQQWQKAINVFAIGHLQNRTLATQGGERPELNLTLDEAVSSQLPVIYSECMALHDANGWIELVGRGQGTSAVVRMLNIDIGGGTTDVAVVEYQNNLTGNTVDLHARLIFRNSNAIAGDALVKRIIEGVLLPLLAVRIPPEKRGDFESFFGNPTRWCGIDATICKKMSRIVHLVFVPIVNHWLKQLVNDEHGIAGSPVSPSDMRDSVNEQTVELGMVHQLNELAIKCLGKEILPADQPLNYDRSVLLRCIQEEFGPLFRSLAKVVAAFDCDFVMVSGKPSELPQLREMLQIALPVLSHRIVFARDFYAGDWYPLSAENGTIRDAKTVTVVGAALAHAMRDNLVPDWILTYDPHPPESADNFWGGMPPSGRPDIFDQQIYLRPGERQQKHRLKLGTRIGRKRFAAPHVTPDQIYVLRWKPNRDRDLQFPLIDVTLQRERDPSGNEMLTIIAVDGADSAGQIVTLEDIELQICTLEEGSFWMDDPHFTVHWHDDNFHEFDAFE